MPQTPAEIDEIVRDIQYRIDMIWPLVVQGAREKHPKGEPALTPLSVADLRAIEEGTRAAIDHVWGYVLGICKARQIRPAQLVPPTERALGYFSQRLAEMAGRLSPDTAREARDRIARHIEVGAREALVGYAAGIPVFPQSEWPTTWFQLGKRKAIAAAIFLLGAATALIFEKLGDYVWP